MNLVLLQMTSDVDPGMCSFHSSSLRTQTALPFSALMPSVLWHWCLGIRKSMQCVKTWVLRCWHGYLSGASCKWFAYGPGDDTTVTPIISCFIKIQIGLTFLVSAYWGSPGEEAVKWMSLISVAVDWVAKGAYCTACKNPSMAILRTKNCNTQDTT